jgi:chemotaxis protein CheX
MGAALKLAENNPIFDKNFVQAFVNGVNATISITGCTEVVVKKPYIEKSFKKMGEVTGTLGMTAGGMKGHLSICFEASAILKIVKNMFGEEHKELTKDVCDAVGEFTNQIYGEAKKTLNEQGYSFQIAIPQVVKGDIVIPDAHNAPTLVVPFELKNSGEKFYVQLIVA